MKLSEFSVAIGVVVGMTAAGSAQAPRGKDLEKSHAATGAVVRPC